MVTLAVTMVTVVGWLRPVVGHFAASLVNHAVATMTVVLPMSTVVGACVVLGSAVLTTPAAVLATNAVGEGCEYYSILFPTFMVCSLYMSML